VTPFSRFHPSCSQCRIFPRFRLGPAPLPSSIFSARTLALPTCDCLNLFSLLPRSLSSPDALQLRASPFPTTKSIFFCASSLRSSPFSSLPCCGLLSSGMTATQPKRVFLDLGLFPFRVRSWKTLSPARWNQLLPYLNSPPFSFVPVHGEPASVFFASASLRWNSKPFDGCFFRVIPFAGTQHAILPPFSSKIDLFIPQFSPVLQRPDPPPSGAAPSRSSAGGEPFLFSP